MCCASFLHIVNSSFQNLTKSHDTIVYWFLSKNLFAYWIAFGLVFFSLNCRDCTEATLCVLILMHSRQKTRLGVMTKPKFKELAVWHFNYAEPKHKPKKCNTIHSLPYKHCYFLQACGIWLWKNVTYDCASEAEVWTLLGHVGGNLISPRRVLSSRLKRNAHFSSFKAALQIKNPFNTINKVRS